MSQLYPSLEDAERLASLRRLGVQGVIDGDPVFDQISRLAGKVLRAPAAMVSLVTGDRQAFKGLHGELPEPWQEQRATPISHSFCQHVAASGKPLIVPDAHEHPLVCENPAITDLGVASYLGMPLTTADGYTLGSFCVVDDKPRTWTPWEIDILREFASLVLTEIEMRLNAGASPAPRDA